MNVMRVGYFTKQTNWRHRRQKNVKPFSFRTGEKKNHNTFCDKVKNIPTEGSIDEILFHSQENAGKSLSVLRLIEEKIMESIFKEPGCIERVTDPCNLSSGVVISSNNPPVFSSEALQEPNLRNSHIFKISESTDNEILAVKHQNDDSSPSEAFSRETFFTPTQIKRMGLSFSSDSKTPKSKSKKSPKTPGSSKIFNSESGAFVLAVTEGRGQARGEVGIAAMDPKRPQLILCQISDNQRYVQTLTKMNVFDFEEVIVPNTFVDCTTANKLYYDIRSRFPTVTLTSVQRRHFSEPLGVDLIKQYCSSESASVMLLLRDKFYALSAAAALIKYIEFTQNVRLAPHSLRIEYQGIQDTMIIDLDTANLLELVMCAHHPKTNVNYSLMGVVKHCHTRGGIRLLRANILQPPCSLSKIQCRLDCVSELIADPLLLCSLEAAISSFSNVESLLNLCTHAPQKDGLKVAEHQLKYTLLLKTLLELLPALMTSLKDSKSNYFLQVRENLQDPRYAIILKRIQQTIFDSAKSVKGSVAAHLHGCFAIRTGINSLLDVAKKTYCEIVQEISDLVAKLRETYDLPLRISFSTLKGFHIQLTVPLARRNLKESDLPRQFILVQKTKSTFSFYTAELVALDQRSQQVLNEIKLMTNAIIFELLNDIRDHVGCLYNLCEHVAELDVLVSFAHVGSGANYVRPQFGEELVLEGSRHPILDVVHDGEVVPNDAFASVEQNFIILTGPNQSGKSIYIRQIALLQIMAQIGCYVPAKKAKFRLSDRIFSRIAFDDSIESNASTLMVEMREVEYLKQNITCRSLVIVDELCRGTSVDEGTSLAFAICEQLLDSLAFTFFTTHYLFITKLEEMYFNVANYHFEMKMDFRLSAEKPGLEFTHLRKPGPTDAELYGLKVAELTSFPKDVMSKAREIASKLSEEKKLYEIRMLEAKRYRCPPTECSDFNVQVGRSVDRLLTIYRLALAFKNEFIKQGTKTDLRKAHAVIRHFKRLYKNLTGSENINENLKLQFKTAHLDEEKFSNKRLIMKPRLISQVKQLPNKKLRNRAFVASLHNLNKNQKACKGEKLKRKLLVLRLAENIKNKYKNLNTKAGLIR